MNYYLPKTGLEIFDLCRAYGIAMLLDYASPEGETPIISDRGSLYLIEHDTTDVSKDRLFKNPAWHSLFEESPDDRTWSRIFLTDKQNWSKKVKKVKDILSKEAEKIIKDFQSPANHLPEISSDKGETLSGSLDPAAFKGLRGRTRGDYSEGQTKVDSHNWALACLGGAISGRYKIQKAQGNKWNYFVIFPVPQRVEINNFRQIRNSTYAIGLKYLSVQNAVAHFSIILAEKMRALAASKSQFADRFSGIFYFSMVQSGRQFKPSTGGNLSLYPLMELAVSENPNVARVLEVWNYLFRKGSVKGCEDLAEAITEFIMCPTPESYERHAKVFLRYMVSKEVKLENLYDKSTLKGAMSYVKT
ncbi:MAG: hypothetical protein AB1390_11555 [Nitrospirota bacterium]